MKYREPPSDLSGIGPHMSEWISSRGVSYRFVVDGESADFGSVSNIDIAHRSMSLLGVLECNQPPLTDQVWLATCG